MNAAELREAAARLVEGQPMEGYPMMRVWPATRWPNRAEAASHGERAMFADALAIAIRALPVEDTA